MDVPNPTHKEYTVINAEGGFLSLMETNNNTKDDVKILEGDLGKKIVDDFNDGKEIIVSILSAFGQEAYALLLKKHPELPK